MIDRDNMAMLTLLVQQWDELRSELPRMHPGANVRPDEPTVLRAIHGADAATAYFELSPVVFNLPERATHANSDLFVVVRGRLAFDRSVFRASRHLMTRSFATEVGYFRRSAAELQHVFGAHYDYAEGDFGHPVFHVQVKSFADFQEVVRDQFGVELDLVNRMAGVIRTIRIPTAQMDPFSLFIQMCADHLLHRGSSQSEKEAFGALLTKNAFCQGAAYQTPRLGTVDARECYRARHWYPQAEPAHN